MRYAFPAPIALLASACALLFSSCDDTPPPSGPPSDAAGKPAPAWYSVSEDPKAITEALAEAKEESASEVDDFYSMLGADFFFPDLGMLNALDAERETHLPRLQSLLPQSGVTLTGIRSAVLLCRMGDPHGTKFASRALRQGNLAQRNDLLDLLGRLYLYGEKSDAFVTLIQSDPDLVSAILEQLGSPNSKVANAAVHAGGQLKLPKFRQHLIERLIDPSFAAGERALYWLSQGDITGEIADAAETWFVEESVVNAAEKKLDEASLEDSRYEYQPGLRDLLGHSGITVGFDAETGELPCRHDHRLAEFAEASQGKFDPDGILETWHWTSPDDFEADYTLSFVFDGRLYHAKLRNYGDWYDVERVVEICNIALRDSGRSERFIQLAPDGQVAEFVFGTPDSIQRLAKEFHMPLGEHSNEAMDAGRAFEQSVLESPESK